MTDDHNIASATSIINESRVDVLELSTSELRAYELIDADDGDDQSAANSVVKNLVSSSWSTITFNRETNSWNLDEKKHYLIFSSDGEKGKQLTSSLRHAGHKNVFWADGGFEELRRKFVA